MIEKLRAHSSFEDAKRALAAYRAARDELVRLGVIRSERSVPGDYGEWAAAVMLDLKLSSNAVEPGFDATDAAGRTYQVKTRIVSDQNAATSFDMKDPGHAFDYLLGVFVSPGCDILGVIRVSASEVTIRSSKNKGSRRLRWTRDCWDADWVEVLYRAPSA
jgi:hypothetical protein